MKSCTPLTESDYRALAQFWHALRRFLRSSEELQLRHHSTVELVDRAESSGLVRRRTDRDELQRFRSEAGLLLAELG